MTKHNNTPSSFKLFPKGIEITSGAKMMFAGAVIVLVVFVVIALNIGHALFGSYAGADEHIIYIYDGENPDSVRNKIENASQGVRLKAFRYLAEIKGYYDHIRPGRYDIGSDMSTFSVYQHLRSGNETPLNLTIPPLHNAEELARHLGNKLMFDSAHFSKALKDSALLSKYGLKRETAVCLFLQNTYEVYWTSTGEQLIERMAKEYKTFWTKKRLAKLDKIEKGFTREQAITLASIVESETANNDEKSRIAGLYINRLHKGIKLQADPTVKFAVGDFKIRRILNRHLTIESPYNTYRVEGLPPGPICISSPESLNAVLNYEHHDYIFMCAKEDFSGTHNFAVNEKQHAENARRFQQALNERGIKK